MSIKGLQFATLNIPLGAGLDQKSGDQVSNPPALDRCVDAEFDEVGQLRTRYPFASIGNAIFGGGTLADTRKIVANDNELLCFTKDTLYSWSPQQSAWVAKGTHLAVANDETPRFVSTGDQTQCDRAELLGTIAYVWVDAGTVYGAAIDKDTGAVLCSPIALSDSGVRPRIVALETVFLLFTTSTAKGFNVREVSPSDPGNGFSDTASTIVNAGDAGVYYDVEKIPGANAAAFVASRAVTTSYEVGIVPAGLSVTQATKARKASYCAIACTPDGAKLQIIRRGAGGALDPVEELFGDLLDAVTLADIITGVEINGAAVTCTAMNIAAAFSTVQVGGEYVCYVVYDEEDMVTSLARGVTAATVDTAGTPGAACIAAAAVGLPGPVGVATRAFAHDGSVFVHLTFAGVSDFNNASTTASQLQNTVFLYRLSGDVAAAGLLVGKVLAGRAGGYGTAGHLPGVALTATNEYAWCGTERRIVPLGTDYSGYADRGPRDVVVTFDTNTARRCVRLGSTLYISGAEIKGYDGSQLAEVGFNWFPYYFDGSSPTGGSLSAGTYGIKLTYRWQNARGESERSTTATIGTITTILNDAIDLDDIGTLGATHKAGIAIEVWRTAVNPTDDAAYYLVTSNDPTVTGVNGYIVNIVSDGEVANIFEDRLSDAVAILRETNPENGALLESLPPPPATIIAATQDRIFLAGSPGDPDRVWYSRLRNDGEIASFHDSLTFAVPGDGGAITGIAFLNETVIVFRERAIYAFPGDGYGNDGSGINYGPARTLAGDVGATSAESIGTMEQGLLFKSAKGWYVLNRGWALDYVGSPVSDYDSETPLSVSVLTSRHQVRILTSARMLIWDNLVNQWGEWTISGALAGAVWDGTHHYLSTASVLAEQSAYSSLTYGFDIETAWIKLDNLQGFGRVRKVQILGEYRSSHQLRIRLARDYWIDGATTYFDDDSWTVTPTTVGGPEEVRVGPSIQQMGAVKIRIGPTLATAGIAATGPWTFSETENYRGTFTAVTAGTIGNTYTIHFENDGVGAGSLTDGAAAVYHFEPNVTTAADVAAGLAASAYVTVAVTTPGVLKQEHTMTLSGGIDATTYPTGEALKLSGIALEIGVKRGPYTQLPAGQKT